MGEPNLPNNLLRFGIATARVSLFMLARTAKTARLAAELDQADDDPGQSGPM
jgi:hypothetical protein